MPRREPPPQATWILEHLATGTRNDALAGDLLEEFRAGRSDAWYWRQTLSACAVSWTRSLALRGPMLVFALLWCALAPAWHVIVERVESAPVFASVWQVLGPFWLPFALVGWSALRAAFLWAGILAYLLTLTILGRALRRREVNRAFLIALVIFPPVAGLTLILSNLYWYSLPGLAEAKLAATSMGQIADFSVLADLIRVPYLVALVAALWSLSPDVNVHAHSTLELAGDAGNAHGAALALDARNDQTSVGRFLAFMVAAGLMNALIAGFLLCRLPEEHSPTLGSLLWRAAFYVLVGGAAGMMGAYLYWQSPASPFRERSPLPFSRFALSCASGWVWVPALAIFSEALSAAAALVAMIGAFLLAAGLRRATAPVLTAGPAPATLHSDPALFEEALYRAPVDLIGYTIALCLYAAMIALASRWNMSAAALLALSAALFGWKRTIPRKPADDSAAEIRRALIRTGFVAIPAILVTAWALLDGVAHRNHAQEEPVSTAFSLSPPKGSREKEYERRSAKGVGGFDSIILWPYREKKEIVPPLLHPPSLLAPGTRQPVILQFTGAYWYLQPPDTLPTPAAHQAQGSPLRVNVASTDGLPLMMDAHQSLRSAVPISRCREIDVELESLDNSDGAMSVALLLGYGIHTSHQSLYLSQQPIVSSLPEHARYKAAPVAETLRFAVPATASLRQFDEITVLVLPDAEHTFVAPKVAIRQFELIPR